MAVLIDVTSNALTGAARATVDTARAVVAKWMIVVVAAAISLIVMAEVDRLIASSVDLKTGESHSLSQVIGPLGFTAEGAWKGWAASALPQQVGAWIAVSVLLDAVFVACYAGIVYAFVTRWHGSPAEGRKLAWRLVDAIVIAEAFEALVLLWLSGGLIFRWAQWPPLEIIASLGKWGVVIVIVVMVLRIEGTRHALGRAIARGCQALWFHRLSAVPVALLAVMACVPAEGVLDQLPDLQRQWVGSDAILRYFLWAFAVIAAAAIAAFALGRARTRRSLFREVLGVGKVERHVRDVWGWWLLPVIVWFISAGFAFVGALVAGSDPREAFGWGAAAFVAIPIVVLAASRVIEWLGWPFGPDPRSADSQRAIYAWLTGDVLAVGVVIVGGLGLVRSMALPVMLGVGGAIDLPGLWGAVGLLIVGLIAALASPLIVRALAEPAPWVLRALVDRNDPTDPRTPPDAGERASRTWRRHQGWQLAIICGACVLLLVLAVWPAFPAAIGPVATTVLVIVCWTAALGAFAVALQEYEPLELFRWLRLRATPVLTLGLVIPLVYSATFSALSLDGRPHEIRMLPNASEGGTSTIDARLDANDCEWDVGGTTIKPVILIAAEGGGIRAAYWTGRAMEKLTGVGCLDTAVLMSSGISGGSVGLMLADLEGSGTVTERLTKLASPETVATAVSGLVAGDAIASALGVKLPSYVRPPDDFEQGDGSDPFGLMWRDRAALIETGWISDVHALAEPYTTEAAATAGFILLNSTDVDSGCRVVIGSDEILDPLDKLTSTGDATAESGGSRCEHPTSQPAVSWWLGSRCQKLIDRATATMLSARFPIVTPGGRLPEEPGCDESAQLIDGGYAEGTGLGTLADLAPQLTAELQKRNATADVPYIPIVVYLRNSSGFDLIKALSDVTAEPLVPLVGAAAKATQLSDAAWLQRLSGALADVCRAGDSDCAKAVTDARAKLSGQIVVVAPETRPTVVPPLGWALSTFSTTSMEQALTREIECDPDKKSTQRPVRLCTLLALAE